jgi:hypothetical protein
LGTEVTAHRTINPGVVMLELRKIIGSRPILSPFVAAVLIAAFLVCASSSVQVEAASPASQKRDADQNAKDALLKALILRPHRSDQSLVAVFNAHRGDFDQLISMVNADRNLVRIAPDFIWTTQTARWPRPERELGITPQRWKDYRRLFGLLQLTEGVERQGDDPRAVVYLLASTSGLAIGGSIKGYARSDSVLTPQCQTLDTPPKSNEEDGVCFKALVRGWYLYYEWE